ncbi:MAG: hypothetical protein AAFY71_17600 [Bacteroidota bacterium]
MQDSSNPYDRLDGYLERLEAKERKRRRTYLILVSCMITAVASTGLWFYLTYLSEPMDVNNEQITLRRFATKDLNPEKIQHIFAVDPNPLILIDPITGIDTIFSVDEYYQFLIRQEQITSIEGAPSTDNDPLITETTNTTVTEEVISENPATEALPEFKVNVEGEKMVGKALTYSIENYSPDFPLILDFGNGITRKVRKAVNTYTYPLPGHFDMHLKMIKDGADDDEILQTIKYQIHPREEATNSTRNGSQTVNNSSTSR